MPLRAPHRSVALALSVAMLALALSGPPCLEPASCPMDQTPAAGTCDGLSSDCCQQAAERPAAAAAPISLAPAPAPASGGVSLALAPPLLLAAPLAGEVTEPPPRAALQGTGRHALLSVFLI